MNTNSGIGRPKSVEVEWLCRGGLELGGSDEMNQLQRGLLILGSFSSLPPYYPKGGAEGGAVNTLRLFLSFCIFPTLSG